MKRRSLYAATAVGGLLLGLAGAATPAFSACQMQDVAEFPVNPGSGVPIVASQIDGQPALLVASTGSNVTLLWRKAAVEFGLKPKSQIGEDAYEAKGQVPLQTLTVRKFQLGNHIFKNLQVYVIDDKPTDQGTSGDIGQDILTSNDLDFDLPENIIRLIRPVGCKEAEVVFWNKAYSATPIEGLDDETRRFYTKAVINGKSVEVVINTGAEASAIPFQLVATLGIAPMPRPQSSVNEKTGQESSKLVGSIKTFALGDEVIRNTSIRIEEPENRNIAESTGSRLGPEAFPPAVTLGADFFRAHRVLMAKSQNMMYFSYMGGPVFDLSGSIKSSALPSDKSSQPQRLAAP